MSKIMSELQFLRLNQRVEKKKDHHFKTRLTKLINNRYDIRYTAWDIFSIVKVDMLTVCLCIRKNKIKNYLSKS